MRENRFSRRAGLLLPNLALVSLLVTGAARGAEDKVPDPEAPGLTLAARSEALLDRVRFEQKVGGFGWRGWQHLAEHGHLTRRPGGCG